MEIKMKIDEVISLDQKKVIAMEEIEAYLIRNKFSYMDCISILEVVKASVIHSRYKEKE